MPTPNSDSATARAFVMTRTFDAPRALVFKAFAEAERLAQWWGPKGFKIHVSRMEFQPGGIFHYRMAGADGNDMWGRFTFREIVEPERLVWINSFSDPDGNVAPAPFSLSLPLEILNTVTLAEQGGKTTLTLHSAPFNATPEEQATFESIFDSMQMGYGGTFDALAAFLAREQAA